jgi:hypothetical protein
MRIHQLDIGRTDYERDGVCRSLWLDISKVLCQAVLKYGPLPTPAIMPRKRGRR